MTSSYLRLGLLLAIFVVAFIACDDDDDDNDDADVDDDDDDDTDDDADDDIDDDLAYAFPGGFLFGTATAGFQVDMGCPTLPDEVCNDTNSDWWQYVTSEQTQSLLRTFLSDEHPTDIGPGHWELYESDFDLAKNELRNNAFRMSIEWSRIFPESTVGLTGYEELYNAADQAAVQHYHDVFAALAEREMTPLVTLHHYTLPSWIHDGVGCTLDPDGCTERGWLDPETIVAEIDKYAGFAAAEFGGEVDLWATQNEPLAVSMPGYLLPTPERTNPPAEFFQSDHFKTAFHAMIEAHARMYDAIKENDTIDADSDGADSQVGLVYALAPVRPEDPDNELDAQAAEDIFYLWNLAFLDAVAIGMFDENFDGEQVLRDDLAGRMDFVGINYKVRIVVEGLPFSLLPSLTPFLTLNPLTVVFDEIHSRGIYEMAMLVEERYGLPSIITENNGQSACKGDIEGEKRELVKQLSWLAVAMEEGADVWGYFYWSLMDNIEWNQGTGKPLGFYAVDTDDPLKTRTPRETVEIYAAVAQPGGIPSELAERYPISD